MELISAFIEKGHLTREHFLEVFGRLNEEQKRRLALQGITELLLRCFDPDWGIISIAFSQYTLIPATRFLATYNEDPTEYYPEYYDALSSELSRTISYSDVVFRDYRRICPQSLNIPCPPVALKVNYPACQPVSLVPGQIVTNPIKINPASDGSTSRAFLALFGDMFPVDLTNVVYTLDDLDPVDDIRRRIIYIVADALEWFGHVEQEYIPDYFYEGFYHSFSPYKIRVLAQIGFTEAFMHCFSDTIPFEWRTVAGIISLYSREAPSAIMLRNSPMTFRDDATLSFDEEPPTDEEDAEWLVKDVITQVASIRQDFASLKVNQEKIYFDAIMALPHTDNPPFKQLCPEHCSQVREFLPLLKQAIRALYGR